MLLDALARLVPSMSFGADAASAVPSDLSDQPPFGDWSAPASTPETAGSRGALFAGMYDEPVGSLGLALEGSAPASDRVGSLGLALEGSAPASDGVGSLGLALEGSAPKGERRPSRRRGRPKASGRRRRAAKPAAVGTLGLDLE